MKRLILAIVAIFVLSGTALAQDVDKKEGKQFDKAELIQRRTDRMVKVYDLSDKQAARLKKLNEEYADKLPMAGGFRNGGRGHGRPHHHMNKGGDQKAQVDGKAGTIAQRRALSKEEVQKKIAERKQVREAYDKELKEILGSEKFAQYQQNRRQFMTHAPHHKKGKAGESCCGNCGKEGCEKK